MSQAAAGRSRARLPRAARYAQLLAAAAAVSAARGLERLTMEAVAAEAGVDKAIVYRHFANRDELLRTLYERATAAFDARVASAMADASSFAGELRAIVELWLDDLENGGIASRIAYLEGLPASLEAQRAERLALSARFIADRIQAHHGVPRRRALIAAGVLMSGTLGLLAAWRTTRSTRRVAVETFVAMALGAVERLAVDGRREVTVT